MISAVSTRGEVVFQIVKGAINTARHLEFLARLIAGASRKIYRAIGNLRVRPAKSVIEWLEHRQGRIERVSLPFYAPESNPDEYLNRDFKTALRMGSISKNAAKPLEKTRAFMHRIVSLPNHFAAYFKHPAVVSAAQGLKGPG